MWFLLRTLTLGGSEFSCHQDRILVCLSILILRTLGGKSVKWRKEALFCKFFPAGVLLMSVGEVTNSISPVTNSIHLQSTYIPHLQYLYSEAHLESSRTSAVKVF